LDVAHVSLKHTPQDHVLDVTLTVIYHADNCPVYKSVANKLEEWLKIQYPGANVEIINDRSKCENKIEVRLRKGLSGAEEFIAYVEAVPADILEKVTDEKLPKIVATINEQLANLGYKIDKES